jgi:hypothetical protein
MRKHIANPAISASIAWVKNVYSLRIARGTNSDQLPTVSLLTHQFIHKAVHNYSLIPLLVQVFTPQLSTAISGNIHPLQTQLYPQSTAPINMKKKENMERNT